MDPGITAFINFDMAALFFIVGLVTAVYLLLSRNFRNLKRAKISDLSAGAIYQRKKGFFKKIDNKLHIPVKKALSGGSNFSAGVAWVDAGSLETFDPAESVFIVEQ